MAPLTGIALAINWLIGKLNLKIGVVKTTRMTTIFFWLFLPVFKSGIMTCTPYPDEAQRRRLGNLKQVKQGALHNIRSQINDGRSINFLFGFDTLVFLVQVRKPSTFVNTN
ncbi:TPA: hypothetical protein MHU34_19925 [Klebsiella pneumoniae]|nr:hypothetical protein [Klebsiella pneumoniae]